MIRRSALTTETIMGSLTLTPLATRKTESRIKSRGEFVGLFAAVDVTRNQRGHVRLKYEWEKRDVVFEELTTDNPALFPGGHLDGESPSAWIDVNQPDVGPEPRTVPAYTTCTRAVYKSN